MRRLHKRSLTLQGHATSLALEPEFWSALEAMAAGEGLAILLGADRRRAGRRAPRVRLPGRGAALGAYAIDGRQLILPIADGEVAAQPTEGPRDSAEGVLLGLPSGFAGRPPPGLRPYSPIQDGGDPLCQALKLSTARAPL